MTISVRFTVCRPGLHFQFENGVFTSKRCNNFWPYWEKTNGMFTVYITSDNLVKVRHYWTTYLDECGQDYVVLIRRINLHFYNKRSSGLESKGLVVGFFFFNFNPFPLLFRTRGDKRQRKRRGKDY